MQARPLAVTAFALLLLGGGAAVAEPDVELGADLYYDFCGRCHGDDREGLRNYRDDLAGLSARLEGATENMPDFGGTFETEEIAALHAYLSLPHVDL